MVVKLCPGTLVRSTIIWSLRTQMLIVRRFVEVIATFSMKGLTVNTDSK